MLVNFFATGIERTDGGIASSNRNVLAGLQRLARKREIELQVGILHENGEAFHANHESEFSCRYYGGNALQMGKDIALALLLSDLVIFDHVHLASPVGLFAFLPKSVRAKTVIFAHGSESWRKVRPRSIKAFQAADLVLTNSNYTLSRMQAKFDGFRAAACPLGLSPQFVLTPSPPARHVSRPVLIAADGSSRTIGDRAMLLVGRMDAGEREKGHRELIAVMPYVRQKVPNAELIFVGGGNDAQAIASAAEASPAASSIFLAGRVDDEMLAALYQASYAFVMPSRQEGFGLVYLEAMNYALPCLACYKDGAADVIVNGETGILVNQPINESELCGAIVELLSNPSRAREYGEAGWRRLNDHFTSTAHQARVEAALQPLLR